MQNADLKQKILKLSVKHGLSHLSSCLTAVDLLDAIYAVRDLGDPVVLSAGHAGLALYVVLEKYNKVKAEELWTKHGTHPNRDMSRGIYVSTGSLGHGLGIALGMAMANKAKMVFCLISDGECAEGSIWEALRIAADNGVNNLSIIVNANGYSALGEVDSERLEWRIASFIKEGCPKISFAKTNIKVDFPQLDGVQGHYKVMTQEEYDKINFKEEA